MKKLFCFIFVLCAGFCAHALDREAFTFTKYDLNVRIEPEQQRLGVRGRINLRNDSNSPQRNLTLQISSSLHWSSITCAGKPVEFVTQPYISDIDHTGALSEALVVLPQSVAPKQSIDVDVGYEGVIPLDVTRLSRIGVPDGTAKHTDWDQISQSFTAVRGIGYVAWYPIATEAASLADADSVDEAVGRWKSRETDCEMSLLFESTSSLPVLFSGTPSLAEVVTDKEIKSIRAYDLVRPGVSVPTFVIADYSEVEQKNDRVKVEYLAGEEDAAKEYADTAAQLDSEILVSRKSANLEILSLPDSEASPFASQNMLLTPVKLPMHNDTVLNIVYSRARSSVSSLQPWVQEGVAHFAQAISIESLQSRQAAIEYMRTRSKVLVDSTSKGRLEGDTSLLDAADDNYLQVKAMYVWWMLQDMVGKNALTGAFLSYRIGEDRDPAYIEKLMETQSHRDLRWFFDDWVYHDHGLPDFRIVSVYPSALPIGGYMVTVTVENLGGAGAEVPVIVHLQDGEKSDRLIVHGKSKASIRIQAPSLPQTVTVNDGSVPETDMSNNEYKFNH
ncbi:MAG TPA: hypothetical protein VJO35_01430 [Terriglobales bacterium]|nr:hypothetical protein [Terriglobales bacterium]